jgi:ribosomal protein S18 acetylase RimI-like enzyme
MTHLARPADENDMTFAHDLARMNMAHLYAIHARQWNENLFKSSWPQTENYTLLEDGQRVGIIRFSQDTDALYIRDMQVLGMCQNRGAGSFGISFAERLAMKRKLTKLRLRVFEDNPAHFLYRRTGFREVSSEQGLLLMEKSVVQHI